jgi:two-component system, LuxR family, response regulator FixJ
MISTAHHNVNGKTNGTANGNGVKRGNGARRTSGANGSRPANGQKAAGADVALLAVAPRTSPVVYVIDADDQSQQKLHSLVQTMNLACEIFSSAREFLDQYDPTRPGCVVMELQLPDISGRQLQQQLRFLGGSTPVIFLTAYPDVSLAVQALRDGAIHFLEKPFRTHDLWTAIDDAIDHDRQRRETEGYLQALQERTCDLNARERCVLRLLGQGKSNQDIARDLDVCQRTVELHRAQLMKKLQIESLVDVIEVGLVLNYLEEQASLPEPAVANRRQR